MSGEGAIPPRFRERLAGEVPADPAELLAKKLKDTCHTDVSVIYSGNRFFVTVPRNFSRNEFTKIGFSATDRDQISREDSHNSWVVTGIDDVSSLGPAGIWPEAGQVAAKGFNVAMVRKRPSYCVVEGIAPGTIPPTPRGGWASIIPITSDQTVLVLPEELVKDRLPDIFPQRQVG